MTTRIVLIDACPATRSLVMAELAADGHEVLAAGDALTGIRLATESSPDLILLAVQLPDIDGFEACELLQIQSETANVPVIFLSGLAAAGECVRGLNLGAADYILKPFNADELRARVRVALRYRALLAMQEKRSMRDGLTGIWNRAYFNEQIANETAATKRHGHSLSCVMLDIDRFKTINDTYGHTTGDDAIRAIAGVLEATRRCEDIACRFGGEEFVILCPGVNVAGAERFAERLRVAIAAHVLVTSVGPLTFTASFGVSELACVGGDTNAMVSAADAALYAAKHAGRNRVCRAEPPAIGTPAEPMPSLELTEIVAE